MGNFFTIDPVFVRVLWAFSFLVGGVGIIAYLIAWIIVPEEPLTSN